jgi:hypothetical protein
MSEEAAATAASFGFDAHPAAHSYAGKGVLRFAW